MQLLVASNQKLNLHQMFAYEDACICHIKEYKKEMIFPFPDLSKDLYSQF